MSDKNKKMQTSALPGFMELLPADQIAFNYMLDVIRRAYETFGFIPLDTPVLERSEVLLAKAGGETEKQIYRFMKGDSDISMRFDLTVPLARYVAEHCDELTFPFRRYAIGKVYRGERPQVGRFREFYQCDIDVIGDNTLDLRFDAEIPSIIYMIFKELGFERFTICINNRKIFNGLFAELGINKASPGIMQAVDKLHKIGAEEVKKELTKLNLSNKAVGKIFGLIELDGSYADILKGLRELDIKNSQFIEGLNELTQVTTMIQQFGIPASNFTIDLTIARGLDYYTGTVYETRLDDYPEIGSVCSGGRYDNLAEYYINRQLPGVGISIGLTRLFDQLRRKGIIEAEVATHTKVLILPMNDDLSPSLKLASELRSHGISTEISFSQDKMKKRLNYASKLKIPFVVFIGEKEIRQGVLTLKDFKTGNQTELTQEELIHRLKHS